MVGLNCLWTTGYEMELMVWSDRDEVTEMKWLGWSDWDEVTSVWSVLVWSGRYEVTGMKWLVWGDFGMKCHMVWNDTRYVVTLCMKCRMVWSAHIWSDWYELTFFPFGMKWLKKWSDFCMKWLGTRLIATTVTRIYDLGLLIFCEASKFKITICTVL